MCRKRVSRLWVVLCGLVVCGLVRGAEAGDGLKEKEGEVMRLIASGSEEEVTAAVEEMIDEFRSEPGLQKKLMKIVTRCKFRRKYGMAAAIDEVIAEKYADSPIGSMASFGAEKARVLELIKARKYAEAEAATESLIEAGGERGGVAGALFKIADRYEEQRELERARRVYERIVSDYPESRFGLLAQKRVVMQEVEAKDWAAARDATDTLIAVFADDGRLLESLYEIKKAYEEAHRHEEATLLYDKMALHYDEGRGNLEVLADAYEGMSEAMYRLAGRYSASGQGERAEALWRELAENLPGDDYALRASAHLIMRDIREGDEAAVEAGVNKLVADYNEHPDAAEWVFRIGEVYFNNARAAGSRGLEEEVLNDYGRAAGVGARVN